MFGLFDRKAEARPRARTAPRAIATPAVLPRVVTARFLDSYFEHLAIALAPGMERDAQMLVTRPLAGNLHVAYAIDKSDNLALVSHQMLTYLALDAERVHALAIDSLRTRLDKHLEVQKSEQCLMLAGLKGLEPAALLAAEVWDGIAADYEGEVKAMAPGEGMVMACVESAETPDPLPAFKALGLRVLESAGAKALSREIFAWRNRQWVPVDRV